MTLRASAAASLLASCLALGPGPAVGIAPRVWVSASCSGADALHDKQFEAWAYPPLSALASLSSPRAPCGLLTVCPLAPLRLAARGGDSAWLRVTADGGSSAAGRLHISAQRVRGGRDDYTRGSIDAKGDVVFFVELSDVDAEFEVIISIAEPVDESCARVVAEYVAAAAAASGIASADSATATPRSVAPVAATVLVPAATPLGFRAGGAVPLADGVSVSGSLARSSYAFYVFSASSRKSVTITVTSLSGDADLFVSGATATPNASSYWWSSRSSQGPDVIVVDFSNPLLANCPNPCPIFIGVQAFGGPASYTVVASVTALIPLQPDTPATGRASPWSFAYFTLSLPQSGAPQPIELAVTPLLGGDVALYVNVVPFNASTDGALPELTCPPPTCPGWSVRNARWSSFGSPSRERVLINPTDPGFIAGGTYLIGVLATSTAPSTFNVIGYLSGDIATLLDGVPLADAAARGAYNYYRLTLNLYGADVAVAVTPVSGDPDLFVSWHAANRRPNATANDASERAPRGIDSVYIPWRSLTECQASIDPGGGGGTCDIFIGVLGFSATTYTVVVSVIDAQRRTTLLDGAPQGGVVPLRQYRYYAAFVDVPPGQPYSLYLRSLAGDADVYARTDGLNPTNQFFQFSSTRATGDDIIDINSGSPYYNSSCTLAVAVYGYTNASYVLTYASSGAVIELLSGVGQGGTVGGGGNAYAYFYISARTAGSDVFLALSTVAGDADVYVSPWRSPSYRPSATDFTWSGTNFGSDTVFIAGDDPRACGACNYIVAVNCAVGAACAFSIAAIISPTGVMPLVGGLPQASAAATQRFRYFGFAPSVLANVTIATVDLTGDVELYVNNWANASSGDALPSNVPGSFLWSSAPGYNATGSGIVSIPASDPANSASAPFTIAAFCISGPCAFGIVAFASAAGPQTLVPGEPSPPMSIVAGETQSFVLSLQDTAQDVVLAATALTGTVVVAMAAPTRPAPVCGGGTPGVCTATWVGTPDQLRVTASTPCNSPPYTVGPCVPGDWRRGAFSVAVYAVTGGTYVLSAFTSRAAARLVNGSPQAGETTSAAPPVYAFQTPSDVSLPDVRVSLTNDGSATPLAFYVTSCLERACTPSSAAPGPTNFAAAGSVPAAAGAASDLFISRFSPAYCSDPRGNTGATCNYFISVVPSAPCSGACVAPFTIVAQSQGGSLTRVPFMIDGATLTQPGTVQAGRTAVYELYLTPPPAGIAITARLDACGPARPSLYSCDPSSRTRCSNAFAPSAADHTTAASSADSGTALISAPGVS